MFKEATGRPAGREAAMRRVLCSVLTCALLFQPTQLVALDLQQPPAVVTDMPDVVDLSYALPETWLTLPANSGLRAPLPPLLPTEVDFHDSPTELAASGVAP